jgi:hypothetical protein
MSPFFSLVLSSASYSALGIDGLVVADASLAGDGQLAEIECAAITAVIPATVPDAC